METEYYTHAEWDYQMQIFERAAVITASKNGVLVKTTIDTIETQKQVWAELTGEEAE